MVVCCRFLAEFETLNKIDMSLIEKYKAWAKYPENYTVAQVLIEIVADLTWLEQEQAKNCNIQRVMNCSTCKHKEVSKYVEPCYGCRDNDGYDNWTSAIVL